MIRFLLDDEDVVLHDVPADLTVLDWLRVHRGRPGTKEGCGSGDCGACTVVVVSPDEIHGLRYDSVNACIAFIGSLHGKQLLTVESLAQGEVLHPVQQAMLDEHGSQCGFCTPGFVMSMFALCESTDAPVVTQVQEPASPAVDDATLQSPPADAEHADAIKPDAHPTATRPLSSPAGWLHGLGSDDPLALSHRIDRALGGNLCRCTGYRPIKRAAAVALARTRPFHDRQASGAIARRLQQLDTGSLDVNGFLQPATLVELATLREQYPDAPLLAGGTDLALQVTQHMQSLPRLVSVMRVPELHILEHRPSHVGARSSEHGQEQLHIGAAVSLARLYDWCRTRVPEIARLLLRYGSDPIRNAATLGGNLGSASPIGDWPPVLLALGAVLRLQKGEHIRELPIDDFFLDYRRTALQEGEFIREVHMNLPPAEALFAVHKVSKRMDDDISSVCGAFLLHIDANGVVTQARAGFGGMAAVPMRARHMEEALQGRVFDAAAVEVAAATVTQDFSPIDDARASADYRLRVAGNLLRRVQVEHEGGVALTRAADLEPAFLEHLSQAMDTGHAGGRS